MNWKPGLRVMLVRHSESYKTEHKRHGGAGEPLTERGREDSKEIAAFLMRQPGATSATGEIYTSSIVQARETAEIIANNSSWPLRIDDRLKNIYMGVFDGLASDEIDRRYPEIAHRLKMWREGRLRVEDVLIPEAEPMDAFIQRVELAMNLILARDSLDLCILVVTRSVGVAVTNLLLRNREDENVEYVSYSFDPSSITAFEIIENNNAILLLQNYTKFLRDGGRYRDEW